jgi:flagellar hook-associated protein 2
MSTSITTPIAVTPNSSNSLFNGTSRYSSDFQQVISRAVAIASLPLTQLQSDQSTYQSEQTALQSLDSNFQNLQSSIQSLSSVLTTSPVTASSSNESAATAQADATALPGTYTIHVVDPGSATLAESADSLPTVTDPTTQSISASSAFTLTVNGVTFNINLASDTLSALALAINGSGAGVSASLVNIGPPSSPDYRLIVQSNGIGATTIQLNDGSQDLLSTLSAGTSAQYQVNGQPSTPITTDSSTVTVAPGLTVNLTGAGDTTVTVAQSDSAILSALQSFVSAYNSARTQIVGNMGTSQTALSGNSILYSLSGTLNNLGTFSNLNGGAIQSLSDLGVSLDETGQLSIDTDAFNAAVAANPTAVQQFLGDATSGFVTTATNLLTQVEDPDTGTLKLVESSVQGQINSLQNQIDDTQSRIDVMQQNLTAQMAAADAAIAAMEQQVTYYDELFAPMLNANGTNSSSSSS